MIAFVARHLPGHVGGVDVAGRRVHVGPDDPRPRVGDGPVGGGAGDRRGDDLIPRPDPGELQRQVERGRPAAQREGRLDGPDQGAEGALECFHALALADEDAALGVGREEVRQAARDVRGEERAEEVDHRAASSMPASSTAR
jgi:hypothetical protein